MGLENMRRWPAFIVFAVCIMLMLSLLNSWGLETDLRTQLEDVSSQLRTCSKQQSTCLEESLNLLQDKEAFETKLSNVAKEKLTLLDNVNILKNKTNLLESLGKQNSVEAKNCQTELESSKNLQVSMSATLEALRFKNTKLTDDLHEKDKKLKELEIEINKLKLSPTKSSVNVTKSVTPALIVPKMSSILSAHNPINEPVIENAAKEQFEDDMDEDTNIN